MQYSSIEQINFALRVSQQETIGSLQSLRAHIS